FLPGWVHMYPSRRRRFANFCHSSPLILPNSEPLPCTTSSCESGSTKFSVKAYQRLKVSALCWYLRRTGSVWKYLSVSCIQHMFHFRPKPRPPRYVGRDTIGHAVDSSAMVCVSA